MRMSDYGLEKLMEWEGFENELYYDVAGYPTIGVGHFLSTDEMSSGKIWLGETAVKYASGLTDDQVRALLHQDIHKFEVGVTTMLTRKINQHQFDALVSFAYNVGLNALKNSTLLKRVNSGDFEDVPNQFMRWVHAGGKKVKGLVNRRKHEVDLWHGVA